jgi:hypothetical protein
MKKQIHFPSPEELEKRRTIALVERFIVEAETYLATHPTASMVLEELKLLRANLPALRAELTNLRRSKSRGKTQR